MTRTTCLAVAAALCALAPAFGQDSDPALAEARALAEKGEALRAAERYGEAIATAQKAGDLQAEEAAAREVERGLGGLGAAAAAAGGATSAAPTRAAVLAALMRKLDPARCGAYVSAPVLARNVLCAATESADFSCAADAASVAAQHATRASSGRAAAVVGRYAQGMGAAASGRSAEAAPLLDAAAGDAAKAGWVDLAAHAATEAAASWVKAGAEDKAAASVTAATLAFGAEPSRSRVNAWNAYAARRLGDAPESVRKVLADFVGRQTGGSSVSAAGGRGGRGGAGGGADPVSEIGKLLPKLAAGKPIVSVARGRDGMLIHWITPADPEKPRPFDPAVRIADAGGVTVALSDQAVALMMVDLKGTRGQPGESSSPSDVRAFYLLAPGETWNVSKDGIVTISR